MLGLACVIALVACTSSGIFVFAEDAAEAVTAVGVQPAWTPSARAVQLRAEYR
jgi:hypothetical protein